MIPDLSTPARRTLSALVTLTIAGALGAAPSAGAAETSRYTIQETSDGGFLRLDQQTGGVLKCSGTEGAITCTPVNDDSAALRQENEELKKENAALKSRVAALEKQVKSSEEGGMTEPAKKQLAEIMGFFEDMVRRLMSFAHSLQNKPGEDI